MSAALELRSCLVCDLVRPELAGKLTILGYFGICPNVHIRVAQLDQPTVLTFVISGDPGDGHYSALVAVFDESTGRQIASTAELPILARPSAPTVLAVALVVIFGHEGLFTVRAFLDEREHFRGEFHISQGVVMDSSW